MTQLSLTIPGSGGIETVLHHRAADPVPSRKAAKRVVQESLQSECAQALWMLTRCNRSTTRVIAAAAGVDDPDTLHHMLARRLPDLERKEKVTCDRVKDARGKTVSARTRVCRVTGQTMLEWRVRA